MRPETLISVLLMVAALTCGYMYYLEMSRLDPDSYRVWFYVLLTVCFFCSSVGAIPFEDEDYGE